MNVLCLILHKKATSTLEFQDTNSYIVCWVAENGVDNNGS